MSNQKEIAVKVTGFIMILSALFLIALPMLSFSTIDYGRPSVAKYDGEGDKKKLVVDYEEWYHLDVPMHRLQAKLHSPIRLSVGQSLVSGMAMIFVFIFFIGSFINLERDDDEVIGPVLISAAIVALALIAAPIIGGRAYNVSDTLHKIIENKELADAVSSKFWEDAVMIRVLLGIIGMVVIGLLSLFVAGWIRINIWEKFIVAKVYNGWKERVFVDILKNRRESILSEFINENQESVDIAEGAMRRVLNPKNELLAIQSNGNIELVKYNYRLEWKPLPIFVLTKEVVNSVSINNFFRYMMADSKDVTFAELRDKLMESYVNRFGQVGEGAIAVFVQGLVSQTKEKFGELMSEAHKKQLASSMGYSEKMIEAVVKKALRKFKSEVAKIGTDEIDFILSNFRERLIREVHSRMTLLNESRGGSKTREVRVLPQGTRFHIRKGDYDFLVIEQAPSVRTISVSSGLSRDDNRTHFNLAFPYVVFLLVFKEERMIQQYTSYRAKPLESLEDVLCRPNLSNMDGLRMCTGFKGHEVDGLIARTNEVVGHFWTSQFNTDWTDNFERYSSQQETLKSFAIWEENSKKNPLFVLDVDWIQKCSLRELIMDNMNNIDEFSTKFGEEEIRAAFTIAEDGMREALMKKFGGLHVKNKYPEIIANGVKEGRDELINQSFDSVVMAFRSVLEGGSLDKSFQGIMDKSITETVEQDFRGLAGEVLIRRRVEPNELIDKIREGR